MTRVLVFGLALALGGCRRDPGVANRSESFAEAPSGDDRGAGQAMLEAAELPPRAEVVALADRLAIAAGRTEKGADAADLALLAGRLRERAFRLDHAVTDAREAIELYAVASERAGADERACAADERRALLSGELARDPGETYRELYIGHERLTVLDPEGSRCRSRFEQLLESVLAFRPTGQGWLELQEQAHHEVEVVRARARATPVQGSARSVVVPASSATSASPDAPSSSAMSAGPAPTGDVVVRPDDSMVKARTVDLREVKPYSWPGGGRVVIALNAPARYDVGVLPPDAAAERGHRIFLDVAGARSKVADALIEAQGLVRSVRLGKRGDGIRVVLDLTGEARHRVFYLPDPFRIVVDLSTRAAAPVVAPAVGRRRVTRVTLDPGHGGWDAGATGPTGLREKDVTLDIAHRAAPALASELGIETMLTRDTDGFVPLEERTARANAFHSDLFVSIHCNATEDGHAEGIEIYMLDPTRQMDAATIRAVARENHHAKERPRGIDPRLLDAQVASIATGLNVAASTEGSRAFAGLLQTSALTSLSRYGKISDHGVKTAAFFVLLGAEMPATLFETSFISNPEDERRLGTADYRQKLADAIVNAVRAYRDGHGPR